MFYHFYLLSCCDDEKITTLFWWRLEIEEEDLFGASTRASAPVHVSSIRGYDERHNVTM